jgi:glutaredoxin
MTRALFTALVLLLTTRLAAAQNAACGALDERQRDLAERIFASEYLYDCCDETISSCLVAQPTCRLAVRLAENICRRVAAGQDEAGIRRALSRRARSMIGGGTPPEVDLSNAPVFGSAEAPVTVVIYACARCPYCSKLVPLLYDAVADGELQNDARLAFRIFPIRGHEGSTEAGLGFAAAVALDGFWPFLLESYRHFDDYTAERQLEWAAAVGFDRGDFSARMLDPSTRETLIASKKEGLVNGVEETPTFFINQRRWVGDLTIEELIDAIEEEAERIRGDQWITD